MVEDSEELLLDEIVTEILNDSILEFCFEVHRAINLGYMELYFESRNNKHYEESKSLERLFNPNRKGGNKKNKFSNQQGRIYPKKIKDLKVTAKSNMLFETQLSMKSINKKNHVSVSSEENNEKTYCYKNSDRTKKIKIEHIVVKPSHSTLNNEVYNLSNFRNGVNHTHNFQESRIFSGVMCDSVSKGNGSIIGLDILKSDCEHLKLLTEGIAKVSSLVHHNDSIKSSEWQSDYKLHPLENEWIEEGFQCSGCKNSESFQNWMQFIAPTETRGKRTMVERTATESLVKKEMNNSLLLDKEEQRDVDIFGVSEKFLNNTISKSICMCPVCHRKVGAVRFANHLSTCTRLGRRRSTRMYSFAK